MSYPIKGWCEFKAVTEQGDSGKHVQAQPGSRHGYYQTSHIPENK